MSKQSTIRRGAILNPHRTSYNKNPCIYYQRPIFYSTITNESLSYKKQIERRPRKYAVSIPDGEKNPYFTDQDPNTISVYTYISYASGSCTSNPDESPELNNNILNSVNNIEKPGVSNIERPDVNNISLNNIRNQFYAKYEKQVPLKIFFSLRCLPKMVEKVTKIKNALLTINDKDNVFVCTDDAKTTFRDNISRAIMKCDFFIPFIDQGWCESNECGDETNLAIHLCRHSDPRKPVIIPIVFKENNVQNHLRCLILTSTWDSIFVETNQKEEENYICKKLSKILHNK